MIGRRVVVGFGTVALVAPIGGWSAMPVAASGTAAAAVPASRCFPSTDNGDPVLKTFAIEPREVDSRTGTKRVTLTATAEDTGGPGSASGVTGATAYIARGTDGGWSTEVEMSPDGKGAFVGSLTVLPQQWSGTWHVSVTVRDAVGNSTFYSADDLAGAGLPGDFTTTTNPDSARPRLKALRLSTSAVDARRRARSVVVTVRATDDAAVATVGVAVLGLAGRSLHRSLELVSGDPQDGIWRGRLTVGRWAGSATARLAIFVGDAVDKGRWYSPRRLAKKGLPSRLVVVSGRDRKAPVPEIASVSPTSVDLTEDARTVQVVARVRDAGSGARRVVARIEGPESADGWTSVRTLMTRTSGTSRDGVWTATLTLKPCDVAAGEWRAVVVAKDAVRRATTMRTAAVKVVNTDVRRPTANIAGDSWRVRRTGPLTVEFSEDVVGVDPANTLVHVGDDQRGRAGADPTAIAGSWACQDAAGAPVDCSAGPVRTAAFSPAAPLSGATNHTLVLNPQHHLGLTDLAGNPYQPHWALGFHTA